MFYVETQRLRLMPLALEQLELLAISRNTMEKSMGLALSNFQLNADAAFIQEFETVITSYSIPKVKENIEHYIWYTNWIIVHKELNLTVGGIGVNGLPSENGQVVVGYFTDIKFESKGIATEALHGFTNWLTENKNIKSIVADTLVDGYASQKVLQKTGFKLVGKAEDGLRWIKRSF